MRLSRRAATVVAVAIVALILQVNPSFAANVDVPCDTDPGGHCYAERTQGVPLSGPYTLNNVTSATAWVRWDCQSPLDSRTTLVNSEFWVITPVASGGLGDDEWVETGITTGIFSGVGSVSHQFFWAREYWAGTHDQYDEFVIAGTPAAHTS